jgi:hypothetical protein
MFIWANDSKVNTQNFFSRYEDTVHSEKFIYLKNLISGVVFFAVREKRICIKKTQLRSKLNIQKSQANVD